MDNLIFDISGKIAIVTGGGGVLGGNIAKNIFLSGFGK
jgi:NAD(P)-dependent dehydrogenase (short-subunit alcohol dehydrogenase family)